MKQDFTFMSSDRMIEPKDVETGCLMSLIESFVSLWREVNGSILSRNVKGINWNTRWYRVQKNISLDSTSWKKSFSLVKELFA